MYLLSFLFLNCEDIPLPDLDSRKELFAINTRSITLAPDVNIEKLATRSEGYSGADITLVKYFPDRIT